MLLSVSRTGTQIPCQTQYHDTGARHGADLPKVWVIPIQLIGWGNRSPERLYVLYYRARTLHSISFNLSVKHPAKEWEYQSKQSKGHNRSQYYIGEAGGIRRWYLPGYVVKEQLYLHVHPFLRALFFFASSSASPEQSSPFFLSLRTPFVFHPWPLSRKVTQYSKRFFLLWGTFSCRWSCTERSKT